jgi:hypothetical protein
MSYKLPHQRVQYTPHAVGGVGPETTRGPLTHVVVARSWRSRNPIAYTFSLEAAQAISDAFNALEKMTVEEVLAEEA